MAVKLFILGRPGSGKTTSAYYIASLARDKQWSALQMNDYEILQDMFREDINHKRFHPTDHGGFDVLDFSVMDIALQDLEKRVQEQLFSVDLITIEFARDDYNLALRQFQSPGFLSQDAYFLYLNVDIEICLQRIHERVVRQSSAADHPSLSDHTFRRHYAKDNKPYITSDLALDYSISDQQIKVIDNMASWDEFNKQLIPFVNFILQKDRFRIVAA